MRCSVKLTISVVLLISARLLISSLSSSLEQASEQGGPARESPCWQKAATQLAMDKCASEDFKQADTELNMIYQQVLMKFAANPIKVARIKNAQRAWINFRDAEVEALYPRSDERQQGSVWGMCRPSKLAELTEERTKELKGMLEHEEGDVCSQ